MNKKLNIDYLNKLFAEKGYTQTDISKKLRVKRQAVSLWLKGKNLPKPDKLLKLSLLLKVKYSDLILVEEDQLKPKIAFRLTANRNATSDDYKKALDVGYAIEELVEFLKLKNYEQPPTLIEPNLEYDYIVQVVKKIRDNNNINKIKVDESEIIKIFNKYYALIVPVLWGNKDNHENAMHIILPRSNTTWVLINVDTSIYDFKFWLVHELGHIIAPKLQNRDGEKFADRFAEEFLLPDDYVQSIYEQLKKINTNKNRINAIEKMAEELIISPYTFIKRITRFAEHRSLDKIEFSAAEIGVLVNKYRGKESLKKKIINKNKINAQELYYLGTEYLKSEFFNLLIQRIDKFKYNEAYVQRLLRMNILDAKNLYSYLFEKKQLHNT